MNVLELYSGIGGMHMALTASGAPSKIKASIEINPTANKIYKHNFPNVTLLNKNIQGLSAASINKLGIDTILMSPPCQPFTRNGLQADVDDERTRSFKHVLELLPALKVERILVENVKGFEGSLMRDLLIATLEKCGFINQEFILSPSQLGTPNSRHRYYCLARKTPFTFEIGPLKTEFPASPASHGSTVGQIIEEIDVSPYYIPDKILLRHSKILDICHPLSTNSCCFTKAYSRYVEGTGSVYTDATPETIQATYHKLEQLHQSEHLELLQSLKLRFFTPREVCRLMNFPESFNFPGEISNRQKYMVLGNSINVRVVSELIKLLL